MKKRKQLRLKNYDYATNGAYFVTICTQDMKCVLSSIVGEGFHALPQVELTPIGKEVENTIKYINESSVTTQIIKYVIMPNHVHLLLLIDNQTGGRGSPPLQEIVKRLKTYTTKKHRAVLWQRSFYDHIIRNDEDYLMHIQYIDENPKKWLIGKDEYYS